MTRTPQIQHSTRSRPRPVVTVAVVVLLLIGIGVAALRLIERGDDTAAGSGGNDSEISVTEADGRIDESDGRLSAGVSVFDESRPGVTNLDPELLTALRAAAAEARAEGVDIVVNSGWRSPEYQTRLLDEAVTEYGSEAEAARWVATATTSAHVSGEAVDVGPARAAAWLSEHGSRSGLCQIYGNEPWHFELRDGTATRGCPRMYADPTEDPRMR